MDEEYETPEQSDPEEGKERSVSADLIRGHINTIILRSLYDGDKYGYEIISEIETKSHGQYSLKQPTLYSALKRLEKDGYITSYWGGSVGGGRRKYFSLTDEGKSVSEQNQSEWEYSRTIIDSLVSDKDFDFNNPAPAYVDMRMLRDTTSRVPSSSREDGELDYEVAFDDAEKTRLEEDYAKKMAELEEERNAFAAEKASFEETMRNREEAFADERRAQEEAARAEREQHESDIAAREQLVEEEHRRYEELRTAQAEEAAATQAAHEQALRSKDETIAEERDRFEFLLAEKDERLEQEKAAHERELAEQETRIREEMEAEFRARELQIQHQNYINLVNAPPAEAPEPTEYTYYNPPAQPQPAPEPVYGETDYQSVVQKLYANAQSAPVPAEDEEPEAESLDGIDFRDIKYRAEQDGIRVVTAGGKLKKETPSESVFNKGKALFMSAIAVFAYCVILGAVLLGIRDTETLPVFYPYFIWGAGLIVLLSTGLAYANRYGERALRRTGPILINTGVVYALLVIVTLIVALAVNGDFSSISYVATFIIVPIVFFLSVIIFGVVYYFLVRPLKKQ